MRTWKTILLASSCIAAIGPALAMAQTPTSSRLDRLPAVETVAEEDALQLEFHDLVRFAGGAVAFRPPDGWQIEEIPHRREVRLVLTPGQRSSSRDMPRDGIWMTYHFAPQPPELPADELSRMLPKRVRRATDNAGVFTQPTMFEVGPWPALVTEFTVDGLRQQPPRPSVRGRHVLVRTEWGIFELHASAPLQEFRRQTDAWSTVWDTLQLEPPTGLHQGAVASVIAAESILGSWKSYNGRMRLHGNGRISIIPDSVNLLNGAEAQEVLTGTFRARDDLLFVTWDDGSLLNFRWGKRGSDLFLTDHEGHISQLKRFFE